MPLADTHTNISVQVRTHSVDIQVAHNLPIDELIAHIITRLRTTFAADKTRYGDALEWISDDYAIWQLTTPTGRLYDGNLTLADAQIVDGSKVILAQSAQRENYKPLIDDQAEAIAHYQKLHFGQWVSANARLLSGTLVPLGAALLVAVLLYGVGSDHLGTAGQYIAAGAFLFAGLAALIGGSVGYPAIGGDHELLPIAAGIIMAGHLLLGGAGALLVPTPDGLGPLNWLLAAAMIVMAAVIVTTVLRFPENLNYATISVGILVGIVCGIGAATNATALTLAIAASALAVGLFLKSPRLALMLARVQTPRVPAQGETFLRGDDEDLTSIEASRRSDVISGIINQKQKQVTAHQCLVGLTWGALAVIVTSAAIVGSHLNNHAWWTAVFYGVTCAAMIYRGKSFDDALLQRTYHIAAFLTAVAFIAAVINAGDFGPMVMTCAVLLFAATLTACYFAQRGRKLDNPINDRMLEIIEKLCYGSIFVLAVVITDAFATVRGL